MSIRLSRRSMAGRGSVLNQSLDYLTAAARRGLQDVLFNSVEQNILDPARADVPMDSGALRSTISVTELTDTRDRVSVAFGVGDIAPGSWYSPKQKRWRDNPDTSEYAEVIHETHPEGAGFLSRNYQIGREFVRQDVIEYLRSAARKSRKR